MQDDKRRLSRPAYALKVVTRSGRAPIAGTTYELDGEWHVAPRTRRPGVYDWMLHQYVSTPGGLELCKEGWHVWPIRARRSRPDRYTYRGYQDASRWRSLKSDNPSGAVWLVEVKGQYVCDRQKLAARSIRFVRKVNYDEYRRLGENCTADEARAVLGLEPGDRVLLDLDWQGPHWK